jgi:hypothetical protein
MYVLFWQNNYRSCSYELFQLITKNIDLKLQQKNYTKVYHIIYLLTKLNFIFYDFSVIYFDFLKYLAEINKKDKDKTFIAKSLY